MYPVLLLKLYAGESTETQRFKIIINGVRTPPTLFILTRTQSLAISSSPDLTQTTWSTPGIRMVEPAAKRVCTGVASIVRKIAVEGNIGEK